MKQFEYVTPTSIEEALELLSVHRHDAKILAGGQSLMIVLQQRLVAPKVVISLSRIKELRGITPTADTVEIGAMTKYSAVARDKRVRRLAPVLAIAAGSVASRHIRNLGTVGGSLAHADPAGDVPVALLALDATISIAGRDQVRSCPTSDWFTGLFEVAMSDDELLVSVSIPRPSATTTHGYRRFSYREGEFPMIIAAVVLGWEKGICRRARVAMGGIGAHPQRLPDVECRLVGSPVSGDDVRAAATIAADLVQPPPDIRGSTEWKGKVAVEYLSRTLLDAGISSGARHA